MLQQMGKSVPEGKPLSSLEASMEAKKKMDAEKPACGDPECTEDHSHAHGHHSHGHSHAEAQEQSHPKCGEPGCCSENPAPEGGQGAPARSVKSSEDHAIVTKLRSALEAEHVEVIDESDGCGAKLQIVVVSKKFEGQSLLAQHRLVNKAASDELQAVHAFNLKTYTPAKWAKIRQL